MIRYCFKRFDCKMKEHTVYEYVIDYGNKIKTFVYNYQQWYYEWKWLLSYRNFCLSCIAIHKALEKRKEF